MYRHRYPQKTAFVETYCKDILERVSKGCHLPNHPISMFIGMVASDIMAPTISTWVSQICLYLIQMGWSDAVPTLDESGERRRGEGYPLYRCGTISASAKWRGCISAFSISHLDLLSDVLMYRRTEGDWSRDMKYPKFTPWMECHAT